MNAALILAGGTGTRVGAGRPKQFVEVLGKPVLAYTTEIFERNSRIDSIEIVCHKDWIDYCRDMVRKYRLNKVKWIIEGGETFQNSVMNGINYLRSLPQDVFSPDDNLLIQYAASPFTSDRIVNAVLDLTQIKGSAVTGTPCYQLMGSRDTDSVSEKWIDRDKYVQIASPYGFRFSYLLDIYRRAGEAGLIGVIEPHTTSLMYALGDKLNLAYGDQTNLKITTKEDIELFELYVLGKKQKESDDSSLEPYERREDLSSGQL